MLKSLLCTICGHKPTVIRVFETGAYCVKCRRCNKYFAVNDSLRIILPWDCELTILHGFEPRKEFKHYFPELGNKGEI